MTIRELSQLYYLNREIELDQKKLEELYARATNITPTITGMPHAPGASDKVADCVAEIADLSVIIAAKQQQCIHERSRLERYIAEIEDSRLRMIFGLRFINGLSWRQVAHSVGGGNTDKAVSKACHRYISGE